MTFNSISLPRQYRGQFRQVYMTRTLLCICLLLFLGFQRQQQDNLTTKVKQLSDTLTIYRQMKIYSDSVCISKTVEMPFIRLNNVRDSFEAGQVGTVTVIFISKPDLDCANDRLNKLRKRYPLIKIITVFESTDIKPKELSGKTYPALATTLNLGGFKNYPQALQNALSVIRTEYFIVLNSQLVINELPTHFIEHLLRNIHGFDIIGGSEISSKNEFQLACSRVKLSNWTFFETLEYQTAGNVLQCESISQQFLAKTNSFKTIFEASGGFDCKIGLMWWQDFFLRVQKLLVVGSLPEIVFKNVASCSNVFTNNNNFKRSIDSLLPFVNKHHVLDFLDQNGKKLTICNGSDPMVCSEKYIFPKWRLKHWAYSGLTAFPFIVERLVNALHFGATQLEEAGIKYVLEGGTLLGFVKIRAVLPWDSGDVDTFVFDSRRNIINLVKQIKQKEGYEYKLRWNAFHVYVTPYYPAHDGLIVYAINRNHPNKVVNIKMYGKLFPVTRDLFKFLRDYYGSSYLESRIRFGDERVSCDYNGYQACMPDCRWDGCGGGRGQFPGILF